MSVSLIRNSKAVLFPTDSVAPVTAHTHHYSIKAYFKSSVYEMEIEIDLISNETNYHSTMQ